MPAADLGPAFPSLSLVVGTKKTAKWKMFRWNTENKVAEGITDEAK